LNYCPQQSSYEADISGGENEPTKGRHPGKANRRTRVTQLDSTSAKRYRERVGTVIGYRPGAKGPLVEFDADEERRNEILQDVALAYLDVLPT
jgi:hypothetical protein